MTDKRPIVVQGDTPGKPENKSLFQDGNIPKKSSGRKSVQKLKQLHSFSTPAYFGRMQVVTNGQWIETQSFGMIVLMQSTRLAVLQGQVRQSSFKFFM